MELVLISSVLGWGLATDVRKPEELEAAARKCVEKFGRIDIVVCGAAGNFLAPAERLSYNAFRYVLVSGGSFVRSGSRRSDTFPLLRSQHGH